ncbi:MAG TPA: alpha/beta hydrolase [Stellaceae bacterium]|nr:alpha/beta hydrolase [Stellaceae bacterium]
MIRRLIKLLVVLPGMVVGGCAPADLVNALAPRDDYRLVADVPYGGAPRQTLDLYLPQAPAGPKPVVVFFYGGNWDSGAKATYRFVGAALAARGFVVVVPDYRLYPAVRYPAFIADGAAATRWTLDHIASYGGDPDRVSLMGHSAGAYIALMLALDPAWLGPARARIRSAVGLAGPYDFLPLEDGTLKRIFATAPDLAATQPIEYADGTAPPVLLATGRLDRTVSPANTTRLAARIRAHGGKVETEYYGLLGHITLIGALGEPLALVTPVLDDVTRFLDATGGGE